MASQQTVLLTGAGGALAAAVIDRFHALGWRTALLVRGDGARLRARYPESIVHGVDLGDERQAQDAVRAVEAETDGIDAVVNLAGAFGLVSAVDVTLAAMHAQLTANVLTALTTTTAALPGMLRRGRGTIVGIAAGQAIDGGARVAPYAASKAALVAYLRSLDHELAPQGVRTLVIYPMGTLDTAANRSAMPAADPNGWISTETLAEALIAALTLGPRGRLKELRVYPDPIAIERPFSRGVEGDAAVLHGEKHAEAV